MHSFQHPEKVIKKMNCFQFAKTRAAKCIPYYDQYQHDQGDDKRFGVSKTFMEDLTLDKMALFEVQKLTSQTENILPPITIKYDDG